MIIAPNLPPPKDTDTGSRSENDFARGWNACREELRNAVSHSAQTESRLPFDRKSMKILFRDLNPDVAAAVAKAFSDVRQFDVACGDIFSAGPADAIVSPANSHGYMDGGIDLVYLRHFGFGLENILMGRIAKLPGEKLPVGQALVVETGNGDIPHMISAPTMTVPGPVPHTQNAYLAFRAALRAAAERGFSTVLCPGLATLTGRMDPAESARQMRRAWNEVIGGVQS